MTLKCVFQVFMEVCLCLCTIAVFVHCFLNRHECCIFGLFCDFSLILSFVFSVVMLFLLLSLHQTAAAGFFFTSHMPFLSPNQQHKSITAVPWGLVLKWNNCWWVGWLKKDYMLYLKHTACWSNCWDMDQSSDRTTKDAYGASWRGSEWWPATFPDREWKRERQVVCVLQLVTSQDHLMINECCGRSTDTVVLSLSNSVRQNQPNYRSVCHQDCSSCLVRPLYHLLF